MDNQTITPATPTLITVRETTAHGDAILSLAPQPELTGSADDTARYRELRSLASLAITWHHAMSPRLHAAELAQIHALHPVRAADKAFDELSHAKNDDWAATHHRWLVAVDAAQVALNTAMAARQDVTKEVPLTLKELDLYKAQVPAEHQILERLDRVLKSKPWDTAEQFATATARKVSIAAETLKHLTATANT